MDKTPINAKHIKIIKLVNGEELICHLPSGKAQTEEKSPLLRLDRPLQVRYVPQVTNVGFRDYIALVKWAPYSDDRIITIPKDKIMTITNATSGMCNSYQNMDNTKVFTEELLKFGIKDFLKTLMIPRH